MEELLTEKNNGRVLEIDSNCQFSCGPGGDAFDQSSKDINKDDSDATRLRVMVQVQELMSDLEAKREADKQMLTEFRSRLQLMVNQLCQQLEKKLLDRHQTTNKEVEVKLQYLNEMVENVSKLESDINNFKNAVGSLFKDVQE